MNIRATQLAAVMLLAFAAGAAHADTWRVDLLIFAHTDNTVELQGLRAEVLTDDGAIPLSDSARLRANGIRVLAEDNTLLRTHWQRLRNATAFRALRRLSWQQSNPPQRGGPALLLRHGDTLRTADGESIQQLEGTLRLTLRRFLHLDANLRWSERSAGADAPRSWPLRDQRRMRSGELHYLDSGRIGILAHIQRSQ